MNKSIPAILLTLFLCPRVSLAGYNDPPISIRALGNWMLQSVVGRTSLNSFRQRNFYHRIHTGGGIVTMIWPSTRILAAVSAVQPDAARVDFPRMRRESGLGVLRTLPNEIVRHILRSGLTQQDALRVRLVSPEMRFHMDEVRRRDERLTRLRERLRYFTFMRTHYSLESVMRLRDYLLFYDTQHLGVTVFDARLLRGGHDPIAAVITRCAMMPGEGRPILVHNQLVGAGEDCLFYLIGERGFGTRGLFYICRPENVAHLQDPTLHAEQINVSSASMVETDNEVILLTVGTEPSFVIRKSDLNSGSIYRRHAMIPTHARQVVFANGYVWVLGPEQENGTTQLFALSPDRIFQGGGPIVANYDLTNVGQMRVVGDYLQLRDAQGRHTRFLRMDPTRPAFIRDLEGVGEADTTVFVDGEFAYFVNRTLQRVAAVNLRDLENLTANPFRGFVPLPGDLSRPCALAGRSILIAARELGRYYVVDTWDLRNGVQAAPTVLDLGVPLGEPVTAGNYFFVADLRGERLFAIDGRTHQLIADVHTTLPNTQANVPVSTASTNLIYAQGLLFLTNQVDGTTKIFDLGGLENDPA